MRLVFALAILLGLALPVAAQPVNQRPMYGGLPKTPQMLAADEKFLADSAPYGTRAQMSDRSVALGWQYFSQRKDIATAMMPQAKLPSHMAR